MLVLPVPGNGSPGCQNGSVSGTGVGGASGPTGGAERISQRPDGPQLRRRRGNGSRRATSHARLRREEGRCSPGSGSLVTPWLEQGRPINVSMQVPRRGRPDPAAHTAEREPPLPAGRGDAGTGGRSRRPSCPTRSATCCVSLDPLRPRCSTAGWTSWRATRRIPRCSRNWARYAVRTLRTCCGAHDRATQPASGFSTTTRGRVPRRPAAQRVRRPISNDPEWKRGHPAASGSAGIRAAVGAARGRGAGDPHAPLPAPRCPACSRSAPPSCGSPALPDVLIVVYTPADEGTWSRLRDPPARLARGRLPQLTGRVGRG